jgi:hypothetical protein
VALLGATMLLLLALPGGPVVPYSLASPGLII